MLLCMPNLRVERQAFDQVSLVRGAPQIVLQSVMKAICARFDAIK
ncbi:MAG: hypothetical protein RhofKO_09560 [Rhodothermales bacterium]